MNTHSTSEPTRRSPARRRSVGIAALAAVLMATTALSVASTTNAASQASSPVVNRTMPGQTAPASFSELAKQVTPAVVAIATERTMPVGPMMGNGEAMPGFPENSPFGEFFRRFFDENSPEFRGGPHSDRGQGAPRGPRAQALGSGFIITASGYVVTNNHVVDGADKVTVLLNDGAELAADIVGRDQKTDLALLKVKTDTSLPYVEFGNSDTAEVGDWVMAVGNPFGLGGTVTAGIVSARGRDIHSGPFDDFLQIDAPINRGNSGGPLFNLSGKVIGVNSAIFSPNGGNVGIGFAIPASLVKPIVDDLMDDGQVERGWLGVRIQPVTPDIADGLGMETAKGALVAEVTDGSPAAAAGLRQGDVILSVGDNTVDDVRALVRTVAELKTGESESMAVWRDGAEHQLRVTIGTAPAEQAVAMDPSGDEAPSGRLGLAVAPVTPELKARFGFDDKAKGAVVVDVDSNGPAAEAGIRTGDLIVKAGGTSVDGPQALADAVNVATTNERKTVLLMVERNGEPLFVAVKPARA